jgi:hypothetical protein
MSAQRALNTNNHSETGVAAAMGMAFGISAYQI